MLSPEAFSAHQRFDSRGKPTVMTRLELQDSGRIITAQALVPSGASTGIREAVELRDNDNFGVLGAVQNVSEIAKAISGLHVTNQVAIDERMRELDGTDNKSRLGANAILSVSLAVAKAGAEFFNTPLFNYLAALYGESNPNLLPTPMMNVINGGAHANNGLDFQEFMIAPVGAKSFSQAMRMGADVYALLGRTLNTGLGDEGGFAPRTFTSEDGFERVVQVLDLLERRIDRAGYEKGNDIALALDVAASQFYNDGVYTLHGGQTLSAEEMVKMYASLSGGGWEIFSIEDGLAEDDRNWPLLTKTLSSHYGIQVVGDDRFVTNPSIFREGIDQGVASAILVKLNQIGTLTETLEVIMMAKEAGYNTIISHRSGETEDTFIADLAVATRAGQIKTGAPARGERTAKYNRLLDIEEVELPKLGLTPEYAGGTPFARS